MINLMVVNAFFICERKCSNILAQRLSNTHKTCTDLNMAENVFLIGNYIISATKKYTHRNIMQNNIAHQCSLI